MRTTFFQRAPQRLAIAATVALLSACGDARSTSAPPPGDAASPQPQGLAEVAMDMSREEAKGLGRAAAPSSALRVDSAGGTQTSASLSQAYVAPATSMIIRNGNASVLVDSLEVAIARITQLAARLGGFVANTQIQSGNEQVPSATIELKLPTARFEQATNELAPLGKVEFVNTTTQDVGEEFVDVTARMTNARHLEDRLVELLARRTGKLEEVLAVERELARVREEIERYEGRLRFLRARVAMSTLTITVHEKAPIVSSNPGENVLGTAAKEAWRNFVNFLAALIASLGWLIPLGAIAAVGILIGRRVLRRQPPAVTSIAPKEV